MTKKKNDIFAEIARQGMDFQGKNLYIPNPPHKNESYLDFDLSDAYKMIYPKKMDTKEELYEELANCRKIYAPYLEDHAPKMPNHRDRQYLTTFNYRLELDADKKDFQSVLSGKGNWEIVSVPHYWGPLGNVRAFYQTAFLLTKDQLKIGHPYICFKAVDYKAHVFINGCYLGSHEGFFAPFEFDFSNCAKVGENSITVIVENDFITGNIGDKIYAATGLGYDDPAVGWHHCPPGFGIYQDCYVEVRPNVFMRDIFVRPQIDKDKANVQFEVYNCENEERDLSYSISVYGQNFEETVFENFILRPVSTVACGMGDTLTVAKKIANGEYNAAFHLKTCYRINTFHYEFNLPDMKLWEPEHPYLYQIQIGVLDENGALIDCMKRQFGMRSFRQDSTSEMKGMFYLNNHPIRLRGSNTMGNEQQCVFKKDFDQLIDDILLAKIGNLNFWRITQRPVQEEVYDYCDKLGLMTQCDLPLFGALRRNQFYEGIRQAGEMERLVRSHPCSILTTYINEPFPNASNHEQLSLTRDELEDFFKACDIAVLHENPDRVIKPVDGDYDPPEPGLPDNHCYFMWYNGHGIDMGRLLKGYWMPVKPGWYYGCGEFGTEGLDPVCIMKKYYPKDWLPQNEEEEKTWSPSSIVNSQTGAFHYFFYETPQTLKTWVKESQKHQEWATKLMTEAFRRDSRMVSFAIHLFIDAFPSGWMKTIMDVDRNPKPAYFAYRNALTPLMVSLRTDRFKYFEGDEIIFEPWICNDTFHTPTAFLQYQVEDEKHNVILSGKQNAKITANNSEFQGFLKFAAPNTDDRNRYTIFASIINEKGEILHYNSMEFEVLKRETKQILPIYILKGEEQKAQDIAQALHVHPNFERNYPDQCTILIDDYDQYVKNKEVIDNAVMCGAKAIFLELTEGDYEIANTNISVKMCSMMPLHFVSRNTGHPYVDGFLPDDFRYWYRSNDDMICPLLEYTFVSDEYSPILTSGNTNETGEWDIAYAAAQKSIGKGSVCIVQVKLAGAINTNPIAQRFAMRLFAKDK